MVGWMHCTTPTIELIHLLNNKQKKTHVVFITAAAVGLAGCCRWTDSFNFQTIFFLMFYFSNMHTHRTALLWSATLHCTADRNFGLLGFAVILAHFCFFFFPLFNFLIFPPKGTFLGIISHVMRKISRKHTHTYALIHKFLCIYLFNLDFCFLWHSTSMELRYERYVIFLLMNFSLHFTSFAMEFSAEWGDTKQQQQALGPQQIRICRV